MNIVAQTKSIVTDPVVPAGMNEAEVIAAGVKAVARQRRQTAKAAAARRAARPFWQLTECPPGCYKEHYASDQVRSRYHQTDRLEVTLRNGRLLEGRNPVGPDGQLPSMVAALRSPASRQIYTRDALSGPLVVISVASGPFGITELLNPSEARAIAVHLLRLADLAEGVDTENPAVSTI